MGHGNTAGHNANDGALTGDNVGADLGTQATGGASEYGDAPPDLTQLETVDEGNEGGVEERGGRMVRISRDIEGEEDLACQFLHPCDNQLITVYGDTIHRNDGRHLDGGIADDGVWQRRYNRVVAHPHPMYNPPKGGVGHRVVSTMAREFTGVRERKWNSERALNSLRVSCEKVRA